MEKEENAEKLLMFGGPLHRLGRRLGLFRDESDTIRLGIALGLLVWGVLVLFAFLEGLGLRLFSLSLIAVHVRFLVVVPLLFVGETFVFPRMMEFVEYVRSSGLAPAGSIPALESEIRSANRLVDSPRVEGLLLVIAFALPLIEFVAPVPGATGSWIFILHSTEGRLPWTTGWYLGFGLTLFRFLQLRWLWRLLIWWRFLWRFRRLDLNLIPAHSDGAGGLGFLSIVHENFAPLVTAVSALCSAQFAEDVATGTVAFENVYGWILIVLFLSAALFVAPLAMFYNTLWICRITGVREYMAMASRYAIAFDRKWVHAELASGESQLGTPDLQSLADLTNSVNVVRHMQVIPLGQRQLTQLTASGIAPFLPLFLLKYPVNEMIAKLFELFTGF